jgi:hypothetical protein
VAEPVDDVGEEEVGVRPPAVAFAWLRGEFQ